MVYFQSKVLFRAYLNDEDDNADEYTHRDSLDFRSDVNAVDKSNQRTAMHYACQFGHDKVVELLLTLPHTDLEIKDKSGATPVHLATGGALRLLLRHEPSANTEAKDENGRTCLPRRGCWKGRRD